VLEVIVCGIILVSLLVALGVRGVNINIYHAPKEKVKMVKDEDLEPITMKQGDE